MSNLSGFLCVTSTYTEIFISFPEFTSKQHILEFTADFESIVNKFYDINIQIVIADDYEALYIRKFPAKLELPLPKLFDTLFRSKYYPSFDPIVSGKRISILASIPTTRPPITTNVRRPGPWA